MAQGGGRDGLVDSVGFFFYLSFSHPLSFASEPFRNGAPVTMALLGLVLMLFKVGSLGVCYEKKGRETSTAI